MAPQATLVAGLGNQYSEIPNNLSAGARIGDTATSLVGFYGATPIAQAAGYGTVVDTSGGTATAATGITTITGTYNSTILANAIATLAKQTNAIEAQLVALGLFSV